MLGRWLNCFHDAIVRTYCIVQKPVNVLTSCANRGQETGAVAQPDERLTEPWDGERFSLCTAQGGREHLHTDHLIQFEN